MSVHALFRVATRAAHDRVDATFSDLDLGDAADYRLFLTAQAKAFLPVEAALDAAGVAALFPDWPRRRRSHLLRADLEALSLAVPAGESTLSFATPAEVVGGAYVLEGSRLGGAVLARSVAPGLPRAFLDAPQASGQWRDFLTALEQLLTSPLQQSDAVAGASRVFDHFALAAGEATKDR